MGLRVACVQLTASDDMAANIAAARALILAAHEAGADFVATPEATSLMENRRALLLAKTFAPEDDPALAVFRGLAAERALWLLIGGLPVKIAPDRLANRAYLLAPDGRVAASYDKIHMFDVDLPGGESYRESATYQPGTRAVTADLPWGRLGLSICYDLRFPHLYRALAKAGAALIAVPSAFTRQTGAAHWHVLLRARAIETGCFVLAPAQCGLHANGRETFGHSLIVSPWGEVLADGGHAPGFVLAELDLEAVAAARRAIPSLRHDCDWAMPDRVAPGLAVGAHEC
jgi:predicted amidohydrolase